MINGVYTVEIYTEYGQQYAKIKPLFCNAVQHKVSDAQDVGDILSDWIRSDTGEAIALLDVDTNKAHMEQARKEYERTKEYYERSQAYVEKVVKNEQSKQEALHESNNM